MRQRLAFIFGYPIAHSISPPIHNAAFAARGLLVQYSAQEVSPAELPMFVARLRDKRVVGANIEQGGRLSTDEDCRFAGESD